MTFIRKNRIETLLTVKNVALNRISVKILKLKLNFIVDIPRFKKKYLLINIITICGKDLPHHNDRHQVEQKV